MGEQPPIKKGKKSYFSTMDRSKIELLIGIVVIAALVLLLLSSYLTPRQSGDSTSVSSSGVYTTEGQQLEAILKSIRGVGKVQVMITYNETTKTGNDAVTTISDTRPEVLGVVVVAEGASDMEIKLNLIRATQIALNISPNKIEIFDMGE